jgi:TMEM175 potassium channel family protein
MVADRADRRPGRRHRDEHEIDFGRIVAFTDGVLAIAITLLVLSIDVPQLPDARTGELGNELLDLRPTLLAYALSFAVIGRFWLIHHRVFATLSAFDGRLMALNLLYLSLIVLVPFTSDLLGEYGKEPVAAIAYATVLGSAALVNWGMITYALRVDLVRDERREETEPFAAAAALVVPGIFFASIPVALLSASAAELMWLLLFALFPVRHTVARRVRARRSG